MALSPGRPLTDHLRPGLRVVFVGFNPGARSWQIGHHYGGLTNQFWRLLHESGLTPVRLRSEEDHRTLEFGIGLTNVVARMTASSSELTARDYALGAPILEAKLRAVSPTFVCFNGKTIADRLHGAPCRYGLQRWRFAGCRVFVVPSSSAANAAVSYARKLRYFRRLAQLLS